MTGIVSGGGSGSSTPGGSTTQLQYNNAGAFGGLSTLTTDGTNLINSANGAASTSPLSLTGTITTGGTGTTNFPALLVQPTGTAAVTAWSTSGTGLGMNLASGFAGNFLDFHVAGAASVFSVNSAGTVNAGGGSYGNNIALTSGASLSWASRSVLTSGANGSLTVQNNAQTNGFILSAPAANATPVFQLGAADAAAPVAQILGVQNVVAGTSNTAGAITTIRNSAGTGTGLGGNIVFQYAPHGSTGTAQNAFATALTINGDTGQFTFPLSSTYNVPNINIAGNLTSGIAFISNTQVNMVNAGVGCASFQTSLPGMLLKSTYQVGWSNLEINGASDLSISRISTGVMAVGNGTAADHSAQLYAGTVRTNQTTVAGLPSASTSGAGAMAFVTDANATFALGLGLAVVGGGANKVPVYSDGTNWIVG